MDNKSFADELIALMKKHRVIKIYGGSAESFGCGTIKRMTFIYDTKTPASTDGKGDNGR